MRTVMADGGFIRSPPAPHSLDDQTYKISLLDRSTHLKDLQQIHCQIVKSPSKQKHAATAKFVESLVASNHLDYARRVFEEMPRPSTFVFNTMIRGYGVGGDDGREGIRLYAQMMDVGVGPDNFTYPFLLKACTSLAEGKGVHSLIFKSQGLNSDVYAQTSLISFYSSFGGLKCARLVFDRMPERNDVSWTAMITGYMKQERYSDGLALFHQMQVAGIGPNEMTLVNVLSASAHLGAFEMGKWVHKYIDKNQIALSPTLGTALVDMYMKCGYTYKATQVFEQMPVRNVLTWNVMIGGLAMHSYGEEAVQRFPEMLSCRTRPDDVTFIAILSACVHSGMVEKGREFFHSMKSSYGVEPNIKHYGCLVDLLGRAGLLEEVYEFINNMPMEPNGVIWGTLLYSCNSHGNVELAEVVMERLIELEAFNDANYVLMSNIYASKGRWNDVAKVRRFMKERGLLKIPGCSSIEVGNVIHEFIAGCSMHPRAKEIYAMLDDMSRQLKARVYVPRIKHVLHDIEEEEKKFSLCHHSEKLAIAFGLVSTPPRTPIRVVKNLRACEDCHLTTKLISKVYDREIIVRDRNRFHHFKDGTCSCGDYW